MDLKKVLGKKYKENMSYEEIQEALADLPDEFVSKEEYDKVKLQKDNASEEASDYKKKYNSTLTEKEQIEIAQKEANDDLQKKYNDLLRENSISSTKADLISIGYDSKLAEETAVAMVDGDSKKVIANQSKFADAVKKNATDEALKNTHIPEDGGKGKTITKADLRKMSIAEITEFEKNNPEEYKKLYE